jgi:hypothetical protein
MIINKVNLNLVLRFWGSGVFMALHLDNKGLQGQFPKVLSSATVWHVQKLCNSLTSRFGLIASPFTKGSAVHHYLTTVS